MDTSINHFGLSLYSPLPKTSLSGLLRCTVLFWCNGFDWMCEFVFLSLVLPRAEHLLKRRDKVEIHRFLEKITD